MTQKQLPLAPGKATWKRVAAYALGDKPRLVLIFAAFVLASFAAVITPMQIGDVIDQVAAGKLAEFPWIPLLVILAAVTLRALFTVFWQYQGRVLGTKINRDLGADTVEAALSLNAQTIEDAGSGDLVNRVTNDLNALQDAISSFLPMFAYSATYFLVMFVSIFWMSPVLAVVLVPLLVGIAATLLVMLPKLAKQVAVKTAEVSTLTTRATENVRGLATARELGIVEDRLQIFEDQNQVVYAAERHLINLRVIMWMLTVTFSSLPLLLALAWGYFAVQQGWATWGMVSTVALLVFTLRWQVDEFAWYLDKLREATVQLSRVCGVLELASQQDADRRAALANTDTMPAAVSRASDVVTVQDVTYGYDPDRPVIHGANLELHGGQSLALVGRSGSGKTTLARLIAGSLTANSGAVRVLGEHVGNGQFPTGHASDGRPRLLICTQEAHLFVGTVADNLSVVKPQATPAEMEDSLTAIGAWEWVSELPNGLDTVLGSEGVEITRDQTQQLALARILLADPHAVILDESTTQLELLDASESVRAIMEDRALIIISHDARIAGLANSAVLLDDGKIVATGAPAEIFAKA